MRHVDFELYDSYMKEIAVSEARENLAEIIEQAQRKGGATALTRRGKRVAVVLGADEYDRLTVSLEDALDRALLHMAREDGDFIPWEQAKRDLGLA